MKEKNISKLHMIYYGMFRGGTNGRKRGQFRWFEDVWEKRMNKGIERACNINSCLWVCLCGHALKNAVCPIFLLNSFLTLSWVRDSLFCVHVCMGLWVHQQEPDHGLEGLCVCGAGKWRMWTHWLSVWAAAKITPDPARGWSGQRAMCVYVCLFVCLRRRPQEELTVGGSRGLLTWSREQPQRLWGLLVSRGETWCLCNSWGAVNSVITHGESAKVCHCPSSGFPTNHRQWTFHLKGYFMSFHKKSWWNKVFCINIISSPRPMKKKTLPDMCTSIPLSCK